MADKNDDVFARLEKKRTGPREGGSRTYDKDGNLVAINGKSVVRSALINKPRSIRRSREIEGE